MSSKDNQADTQRGTHPPKSDNPQKRDLNAASRVALALKLRAAKMTYDQIASQCGYADRSSARKAIMRELDRTIVTAVEELRREELLTLDMLQQKCYTRMESKEHDKVTLFAVDRILAIQERRAKLTGLDVRPDEVAGNVVVIREVPVNYLGLEPPKNA